MPEKVDIYDLLGVLIPGVLIVCALPLAFPEVALAVAAVKFPDGFAVIALVAVSAFAGFLAQALASAIEPVLNATWGGRMSERALTSGLGERYFTKDDGVRIRAKLLPAGATGMSDQSLFNLAVQLAESVGSSRVSRFNALYAYHRVFVLLAIVSLALFIWSFWGGLASRLTCKQDTAIIVVLAMLVLLFWYRTKQRAVYFVREVFMCAERAIDRPAKSGGENP